MEKIKKIMPGIAAAVLLLILMAVILLGFGYRCAVKALTGIPCPTCGMTRAYLSLLRLDFKSAFYYHPLFWLVPPVAGLFLINLRGKTAQRLRIIAAVVAAAAFVLVYLLRLFVFSGSLIYLG